MLQHTTAPTVNITQPIWGYVAIAFNRVDIDRQLLVGPDRLCAEWVIKNGGGVRTVEVPTKLLRDYNSLPPESWKFRIMEVDASDASIMKIGLEHFKGCNSIYKVILHNCEFLEEDGLNGLVYLRNTLTDLQVSKCENIPDEGLTIIGKLKKLKKLRIFNMPFVKNLQSVVNLLRNELPQCDIDTKK